MKRLLGYKRIWEVVITIGLCFVLLQTSFSPWLAEVGLDLLFKSRPPRATSQSIVIIGIDEQSIQDHGPWPFPRSSHAKLLDKLKDAKAIGFDLIFSESSSDDKILEYAIVNGPPVTVAIASNYQGALLRPEGYFSGEVLLGHVETERGTDGLIRRVQLRKYNVPVLAAAMAKSGGVGSSEDSGNDSQSQLINFYGPEFTFIYLSYGDVLAGVYADDFFENRYVLIGSRALALGDVHITPYSKIHPIPGVEVQATILNNILDKSFICELNWLTWIMGLGCFAMLFWLWPRNSETRNAFISVGFAIFTILIAVILFRFNYFLNVAVVLFVLLVSYIIHSLFWWVRITSGMIKEINMLDGQLEDGVEKVFMRLPSSLTYSPKQKKQLSLTGGFQKHINRMHRGIQALALQNGFINHLLSEETPPLILWQKESGYIVLANNLFTILWNSTIQPGQSLPTLEKFHEFISTKIISDQKNTEIESTGGLEFGTVDRIVDILTASAGKKFYHRVVIHNVTDKELGFTGILASFTDVTEIRELERLKSEVMNIVSHELKLPLTTIMGFAEMLSESLEGPEREFALQIQSQSNRLAKMIEDFLDIARIESGKYLIHKYPFDLLAIIHDAASGVAHSASVKDIKITYELPRKTSPLLGDESLLTQAILNLLDNAVKFSPISSQVKLSVVEKETYILVLVEDTGEGIPDNEKPKIFEKFIRGAGQVQGSGFGLGLSFVKEVIEGHSGEIIVEDSKLGGAKFTIVLPKSE
ncbi:CHASE2 domain-containing protein [Desulforhopalus sp. 52FAK]